MGMNEGTVSCFLNFGTGWKCVISFILWYPVGMRGEVLLAASYSGGHWI